MWPFRRAKAPTLTVDPHAGDQTARAINTALAAHDWAEAGTLLRNVTDGDDRAYYLRLTSDIPDLRDPLGEWVAAEPGDGLPLAVRGAYSISWAWRARGTQRAQNTSQDQFREFFRRLRLAEDDLDDAIAADPDDVAARSMLVVSARGRQIEPPEARARFDAVVERHPGHLYAHQARLQYLCAKWYGSHEEMFAFARDSFAKEPDGSQLGGLIPEAHVERWEGSADYFADPAVRAELREAAERSIFHPSYVARPGWVGVHNHFAFALSFAGEHAAAARAFAPLGDLVSEYPWAYLGQPGKAFTERRATTTAAVAGK